MASKRARKKVDEPKIEKTDDVMVKDLPEGDVIFDLHADEDEPDDGVGPVRRANGHAPPEGADAILKQLREEVSEAPAITAPPEAQEAQEAAGETPKIAFTVTLPGPEHPVEAFDSAQFGPTPQYSRGRLVLPMPFVVLSPGVQTKVEIRSPDAHTNMHIVAIAFHRTIRESAVFLQQIICLDVPIWPNNLGEFGLEGYTFDAGGLWTPPNLVVRPDQPLTLWLINRGSTPRMLTGSGCIVDFERLAPSDVPLPSVLRLREAAAPYLNSLTRAEPR